MPRSARAKSHSGIYHVMARGINRDPIFHDAEDFRHFLTILDHTRLPDAFALFAYCLMDNHIHLLLREQSDDLARSMKRINARYASWYNAKYDRIGPLFQDRFKSEAVDDDSYLLSVLRYIHQNPVKAHLAATPESYAWSSCAAYYNLGRQPAESLDTAFILGLFADDTASAVRQLKTFSQQDNTDTIIDFETTVRMSDAALRCKILGLLNGEPLSLVHQLEKQKRDTLLQKIKDLDGVTQRQIARVLGIPAGIVFKS